MMQVFIKGNFTCFFVMFSKDKTRFIEWALLNNRQKLNSQLDGHMARWKQDKNCE